MVSGKCMADRNDPSSVACRNDISIIRIGAFIEYTKKPAAQRAFISTIFLGRHIGKLFARKMARGSQFFFDTQELVIFCNPVAS